MKRKLISCLFLTAGIALAFLLGGCVHSPAPAKPAGHMIYSTVDTVHVSLVGNISDYQSTHYQQTLLYMKANGIKDFHIHLFSKGGSVVGMIAILDILELYKAEGIHITTYNNGFCMSASVPIFLMGDVRIMRPNAFIMIHPYQGVVDKATVSDSTWKALERLQRVYTNIIVRKTSITAQEITRMMDIKIKKNQNYIFAFEALKLGFATEVK